MFERRTSRGLATLLALLLTAGAVPAAGQDLTELLRGYGLQPLPPGSRASDFELPLTGGGRGSLSDFQGQWVLLTFWATWCGYCRRDLPRLEALHRERVDDGLTVVGVSIDNRENVVAPYMDRMGLTFPNFWDEGSRAAATYRASSVPTTYLVDPNGALLAVSRGAREWSQLDPLFDRLLAATPPSSEQAWQDQGSQVAAAGPAEPAEVTDPPTADVALLDPTPEVGETFHLEVALQWAGEFRDYLPLPPQVTLPEGVTQQRVTAETDSREGRNTVHYRIALAADAEGRYALDPVELRYQPRTAAAPVATLIEGPTVEVGAATIAGVEPATLVVGAAAATAVALVGFVLWRRRASATELPESGDGGYAELKARFERARKLKMQGNPRAFVLELAALDLELSGNPDGEGSLNEWTERVRYGGEVPPSDELDRLERRVERALAGRRPDPERTARAGLKLKHETRASEQGG